MHCTDSRHNAQILVEQRACTCSLLRGSMGTGFPRQHGGYLKGLMRNLRRRENSHNSICADIGVIGQRMSLHNKLFSNMTSLPSPAAEQVSLGNTQCFQRKETLKQHAAHNGSQSERTEYNFHLDLCSSWIYHYPPFLQQNKELYILPYFPFIAPSSCVFVLLRLQLWLRILMRVRKTLLWVGRFK